MTTQTDTYKAGNPETVSETLEDAFASSIGRIQEFIEDAPGLDKGSPEQLAELVRLARSLEARTASLWANIPDDPEPKAVNGADVASINNSEEELVDRLDNLDYANLTPERTRAIVSAINAASALADDGGQETGNGADNPSDHSAYDDLTLTLERLETLLMAINDVEMSGEDRNVVGLAALARQQLATAERICQANSKRWR